MPSNGGSPCPFIGDNYCGWPCASRTGPFPSAAQLFGGKKRGSHGGSHGPCPQDRHNIRTKRGTRGRTALHSSSSIKMSVLSTIKYGVTQAVAEMWLEGTFGDSASGTVWHVEVRTAPHRVSTLTKPGGGGRTQLQLEDHSASSNYARKFHWEARDMEAG